MHNDSDKTENDLFLPLSVHLSASAGFCPLSCPHTEEKLFSEEEEARVSRFKEFQGIQCPGKVAIPNH